MLFLIFKRVLFLTAPNETFEKVNASHSKRSQFKLLQFFLMVFNLQYYGDFVFQLLKLVMEIHGL